MEGTEDYPSVKFELKPVWHSEVGSSVRYASETYLFTDLQYWPYLFHFDCKAAINRFYLLNSRSGLGDVFFPPQLEISWHFLSLVNYDLQPQLIDDRHL